MGTWFGRTQSPGGMKPGRPSSRKSWWSGEGPQKKGSEECRPFWSQRRMKSTGGRKGTSPHTDSSQKRGNVSFLGALDRQKYKMGQGTKEERRLEKRQVHCSQGQWRLWAEDMRLSTAALPSVGALSHGDLFKMEVLSHWQRSHSSWGLKSF